MSTSNSSTKLKRILAIDFDQRDLRIVHALLSKREPKIDRVFSVKIPPDLDINDPQQMGGHIRAALEQEGIRTRHVVVDIPRDQAILNTLQLPCSAPDELPGMVQIQIAKELPFPVSEAAVDFTVPPRPSDEPTSDVLVAAVRWDILDQYAKTCETAGLKLIRVGLRPFANKVSVCAMLEDALPKRVMFVDVGPTLAEIDVITEGQLTFSRAASVHIPQSFDEPLRLSVVREEAVTPAGDISDEDGPPSPMSLLGVVDSLVLEVMRSLEAYRAQEHGARIDRVVVGGDSGVEEALVEAIEKRLQIDSETYNPATSFGWDSEEGVQAGPFAAALGLILGTTSEGDLHFDFLHPKRTVSQTKQKLKKAPLVALVAILFMAVAPILVLGMTKGKRDRLAGIEKRIGDLEGNKSENKAFLKVFERAQAFDKDQHIWVDVLYEMLSALPSTDTLVIDEISMDQKDGRVVLKTRGKRRDTGSKAIEALEGYRRKGTDKQRFKVLMGAQKTGKPEDYRYTQDLTVTILDDRDKKESGRRGSSRG